MMKMKLIIATALVASQGATAGDYEFDWSNTNDMRGAWLMCATTAFTEGECPTVLEKCWLPPLIEVDCDWKGDCDVETKCVGAPSFSVTDADITDTLEAAAVH